MPRKEVTLNELGKAAQSVTRVAELLDGESRGLSAIEAAERKAWLALAGYKFWMFGYHAAQWVLLKGILPGHRPNPWKDLVDMAKAVVAQRGYKGEDNG